MMLSPSGIPITVVNEAVSGEIGQREVFATKLVVKLTVDGDPPSKQRPRFHVNPRTGARAYTPKTTRQAEDAIGWLIKMQHRQLVPDAQSAFWVCVHFFTKDRQRKDLDNMCKLVFDACNGIVWKDDLQVEALTARVSRMSPSPRTEIEIYAMISDTPFVKCEVCGTVFRTYPSWPHRKMCSRKCTSIAFQNGKNVPCKKCGKIVHLADWRLKQGNSFYCSQECVALDKTTELRCAGCHALFRVPTSLAKRKKFCSKQCHASVTKTTKKPGGTCKRCGGPVSRKEYERCAKCRHIEELA